MGRDGKRGIFVRILRTALLLAVLYHLLAVGYYLLPWSKRVPMYRRFPLIDHALVRTGFRVVDEWDGLGLRGEDSSAVLNGSFGAAHTYGGQPAPGPAFNGDLTLLENNSYLVGYSETMKNPLWAAYRVFDVPSLKSPKRPSHFRIDKRTEARVRHDAYRGSGYDRGHMAPNFAIATRYGVSGQRETFQMSNVIPQTPMINRYIWKDLEQRIARRYGRYLGEVWVITGPVFREPYRRLPSGVAIPSAYYKIVADEHDGSLRVLAFLIQSREAPYTRLKSRLVSVDELEALTGLDFFPELEASVQARLEAQPAERFWPWVGPAFVYRFQ